MARRRVIDILPTQAEFHACETRVAGLVGGLGAGKSKAVADWFVDRLLMYPHGNHCVAAKDLPQLKRGTLLTLRGALDERGVDYKYNLAEGTITLKKNGARVIPLTAENFLAWRALEADTIWADELADWGSTGEEAFLRYLLPRLRYSPRGKQYESKGMKLQCRFSTNPPLSTSHWLVDLLQNRAKDWPYWHMSTRDNFLMPDHEAYVKMLEDSFSPDLWPILIDGKFGNAMVGNVYKGWDRSIHALLPTNMPDYLPPLELDPTKPLLWGLDFNVHMMCSVVLQAHAQTLIPKNPAMNVGGLVVQRGRQEYRVQNEGYQPYIYYGLDELILMDKGVPEVADEFIRRYGDHARRTGVALYGDASGGARSQQLSSQSSARTNWEIIYQRLHSAGIRVSFRVPSVNPSVLDRVNAVKAQLRTREGVGMLIRPDKCSILCRDLDAVKFVEGKNDIDKTDLKLTHISDALGYIISLERRLLRQEKVDFINPMGR